MDSPKISVKCGVSSCDYWKSNMCHAKALEVNPMNSANSTHTSSDTQCTTFIPKA